MSGEAPRKRWKRRRLWALIPLVSAALGWVGYEWVIQSDWLLGKIHERVVTEVRQATGGEPELERVTFDREALAVDVEGLRIRGADGEPFVEVPRLRIGLGIESLLRGRVYVRSLRLEDPFIQVRTAADGSWNLPDRESSADDEAAMGLTAGLLEIRNGVIEYNGEPYRLEARAEGVDLDLTRNTECASASFNSDSVEWRWADFTGPAIEAEADVELCGETLEIKRAILREEGLEARLRGSAAPVADPRVEIDFELSGELGGWLQRLDVPGASGRIDAVGEIEWSAEEALTYRGRADVSDGQFAMGATTLRNIVAAGAFSGTADAVRLEPLSLELLGGRFDGFGEISDPLGRRRALLEGEVAGFRLSQALEAAGVSDAPWTAALNAWVHVEGSSADDLEAQTVLRLTGSPTGRALSGAAAMGYQARTGILEVSELDIRTESTRFDARGSIRPDGRSALAVGLLASEPDDIEAALVLAGFSPEETPLRLRGDVEIRGDIGGQAVAGGWSGLDFEGSVRTGGVDVFGGRWDALTADIGLDRERFRLSGGTLTDGDGRADLDLEAEWGQAETLDGVSIRGTIRAAGLRLKKSLRAAGLPELVTGRLGALAHIAGTVGAPDLKVSLTVEDGLLWKEPFERLSLEAASDGRRVEIAHLEVRHGAQSVSGSGAYDRESRRLEIELRGEQWSIGDSQLFAQWRRPPAGLAGFNVEAAGVLGESGGAIFESLEAQGRWRIEELAWNGQSLGAWSGSLRNEGEEVRFEWSGEPLGGKARGEAAVGFANADVDGSAVFSAVDPGEALRLLGLPLENVSGAVEGALEFNGSLLEPETITAEGAFDKLELVVRGIPGAEAGYALYNPFPMRWALRTGVVEIEHMRLAGEGTNLEVDGDIPVAANAGELALTAEGEFNLSALQSIFPDIEATGMSILDIRVSGEPTEPRVNGTIVIRDAAVRSVDFPNGLTALNGELSFAGSELRIEELTASSGGGRLSFSGVAHFGEEGFEYRFVADADRVRVRFPENLSSLVNGRLTLAGARRQSLLAGEIIVTRVTTKAQISLGDLLAALREPQKTPPKSSLLENLKFNVQVFSGADLEIETAAIRDIEATVDLKLVGTWISPSLLGRIDISSGQMNFHGSRYTINRGEIAFVNPFRVEPVIDFELATRIRNINIALILAGPIRRLNFSYRSDPPLPVADLVNLVALGRTPTFDPVASSQQRIQQQSLFQTGANNVFSQAIERPVSPGLQRFFGVSRLKVDPQIGGAEANPTARISTEQQITNEVTLIYTYDVSASNQQTVRLEYAPDRAWTFVLTRDENGLVGGDILFKRRLE